MNDFLLIKMFYLILKSLDIKKLNGIKNYI